MTKFVKLQTKRLCDFGLDEKWLQNIIADNTEILGLGDNILRDRERRQPNAGRLDLLLETDDNNTRYEVEIQLGATDESHIIRTIEYWDLERKRYPQYEHCAVIIAEEITERFFNVISLFNGQIPIIAFKLTAVELPNESVGLVFTKVMNKMNLGLEESEPSPSADKEYWEKKVGASQMSIIQKICDFFDGVPNYTKRYIGIKIKDQKNQRMRILPKKQWMYLRFFMPQTNEANEAADCIGVDYRRESYWFRINDAKVFEKNKETFKRMFNLAFNQESDEAENYTDGDASAE